MEYPHLSSEDLSDLADAIEREGLNDGITSLKDHPNRQEVLADLFNIRTEGWLHLVADEIRGDCLDLYGGFGKRTEMLAELAETVCPVDPNPSKLRILSARSGVDTGTVVDPTCASVDALPFSSDSFETIVGDMAALPPAGDRTLRRRITDMRRLLDEGGTLIVTLNGWPRLIGLDRLSWPDGSLRNGKPTNVETLRGTLGAHVSGYRSLFRRHGFDIIRFYALLPSRAEPNVVFRADDEEAANWCIDRYVSSRSGSVLATAARHFGVLKQVYPSYFAVCTNGSSKDSRENHLVEPDGQVLMPGDSRSVVLELSSGRLDTVRKIPNSTRYAETTARENAVLETLSASDRPIVATLPSGSAGSSPFGPVRIEEASEGIPLAETIEPTPEAFRGALATALDWLAEFQRTFRGDAVVKSPSTVRSELECRQPEVGTPPEPPAPVELFETACHGDFSPWNVLLDRRGRVVQVFDWEYAALVENPITDVGLFFLNLCESTFDDFEDGIEAIFERETPYSAAFEEVVRGYCSAVGIAPRAIGVYLPYGCIRMLNQRPYSPWTQAFAGWIRVIWDRFETILNRLDDVPSSLR